MDKISQRLGSGPFDDDYRIHIMGILKGSRYASRLEDASDAKEDTSDVEEDALDTEDSDSEDTTVEDAEDLYDPDYLNILDNLTDHGDSIEVKTKERIPIVVKYEGKDDLPVPILTNRNSNTRAVKSACTNTKKHKFPTSDETIEENRYKRFPQKKGSKRPKCTHRTDDPVLCCKHVNESRVADENYLIFLNNVREHEGMMILELGDITIEYDKIESPRAPKGSSGKGIETSDDLRLLSVSSRPQPRNAYNDEILSWDVCYDESLSFEDNLTALLNKPYNVKEHKELEKNVSARKNVHEERRVRGRSIVYISDRPGKSLLDNYPDFAREFKVAADPHRALTLLRGFYFWLMCLAHKGAFKPWLSPQDHLAIVPAPEYEMLDPIQIAMPNTYIH